jgi:guanylate kinase
MQPVVAVTGVFAYTGHKNHLCKDRMSTLGSLFIISAASGTGKTSLVIALLQSQKYLTVSISHTTRKQRPGEVDGEHYHFIDEATFIKMRDNREFLEHAHVFDNYYGTSAASVKSLLESGKDVILEIDWQGALQVKAMLPESISIFILPPSITALDERLRSRGQDDENVIQRRMQDAKSDIAQYEQFDYIVINDHFEEACKQMVQIFKASQLLTSKQARREHALLEELIN